MGIERGIARETDSLAMVVEEGLLIRAVFREVPDGNDDGIIISEGPETVVKQPMGVLAQRQSVSGIVVSRIGELMNVRCVDEST